MEGREFLRVATLLLTDGDEAFNRASIGRSYYAAYLEARAFCEHHLGLVRTRSSHEHQVVPALIAAIDPSLAATLKFLRARRNMADYDLHVSGETVARTTYDALAFAREVITLLDTHAERIERERSDGAAEDDPSLP